MPAFSAQEDVQVVFSSILDGADTRLGIHDSKQSSFSYDVPGERGLAEISRYLHASSPCFRARNASFPARVPRPAADAGLNRVAAYGWC